MTVNAVGPVLQNPRVSCDVPDVLNGTLTPSSGLTSYSAFSIPTKMVDYATITFTVDYVSPNTGFLYKDVTSTMCVHDTPVMEVIPQTEVFLEGMTSQLKFKLKWQTSGNPVTNALYIVGATTVRATIGTTLNVVDAANGIYSVDFTPAVGSSTNGCSLTPKWTLPRSQQSWNGSIISVTLDWH